MNSMFSLKFAIFFQLQPVRRPLLVLGRRIIAPFAFAARQCNDFSWHNVSTQVIRFIRLRFAAANYAGQAVQSSQLFGPHFTSVCLAGHDNFAFIIPN